MAKQETLVQGAIVSYLRLLGHQVWHTSAFRQSGPSGVSKGVPDLLVLPKGGEPGVLIGIEVKRSGKLVWSSPEQEAAFLNGAFSVAQSPEAAAWIVSRNGERPDGVYLSADISANSRDARLFQLQNRIRQAKAKKKSLKQALKS